jgi:eukaryotic-like serine/threonine-protein kinase
MNAVHSDAKSIFLGALDVESPEKLAAYLDQQCGASAELRRRVEELLNAHREAGGFLGGRQPQAADLEPPVLERPGTVIGPYKLLEQIGAGGFGVVFLAEQERPIRRRVALKIIKPGMDTRQVIARFDVERQALALMDHPHIAKVFDAGTTESGRPYFVMELIRGVPLTDYCDECHRTTRERLELFLSVCQAVQHAHQKGVIHRDLKPTNVLVTMQDGQPAPKIIDFGVAKAVGEPLAERTLMTGFAQMLGTPLYMSPEQAELSPLGVDTRSDIYSLGVLLYELLTGTTPFDKDRLHSAAYDELRRIIREEEPLRPSMRISTLAADLATTTAERRSADWRRLENEVHGDLDWIVMKCLEKDRNRRYETANALAADVLHYLRDEPVSAVAPSRIYRANKFIRRNKWSVIAVSAVLMGLIAGIIGMAIGLVSQARQRAESRLNLAIALQSQRKYAEAEALFREGLQSASSASAEDRQRAALTRLGLAKVVYDRGDAAESERLHRDALTAFRAAFPPGDPNIAHAITNLALLLQARQRFADAEPLFREAYQIYRRALPRDHFAIGVSARRLGSVLVTLGRYAEAEPTLRESVVAHQLAVPLDDWALALARMELGRDLVSMGRFSEAESLLLDAERALDATEDFRSGQLALAALYSTWHQAEPGKGYDAKALVWTRKLMGTFVRFDKRSLEATERPQQGQP